MDSLVLKTQITHLLLFIVVTIDICAMAGCHRGFYRRQADTEAGRLVQQKACDPRWDSADGQIDVDPQSRMFNPFSEDHPPIPPDDAASHQLMHCVDGKPGYPHWHANGDTDHVDNPQWRSYLPVNEQDQVVVSLDRAYQLALLHSTDFQQQRETLYLSALDVSLERFGFDSQLFAGFNSFFSTQGRFRGGGSASTLSGGLGSNGQGFSFQRLGTTGANFAVGLANTILFNFGGPNTQSATTLIDFSFIQPLLRGAGRDRIMESLTQAERTLLANVRQFERFRRGFYLQVAIGRNPGAGPNRGGQFLGVPSGASSNIGGYFGLLLQQQQIRNQEFNVRQLEAVLEQFREFFLRERLDAVQLKLFESNVYGQQSALVTAKIQYQSSVDLFKQTIGLPPDVELIIDDDFLDRFELISDQINDRLILISQLRDETGDALNGISSLLPNTIESDEIKASGFKWSTELKTEISGLKSFIDVAQRELEALKTEDLRQIKNDFEKLDRVRDGRLAYLEKLEQSIAAGEVISDVDPRLYQSDSIPTSQQLRFSLDEPSNPQNVLTRIEELETKLAKVNSLTDGMEEIQTGLDPVALREFLAEEIVGTVPSLLSELNNILLEVSLLQAQARSNSIEMFEVEINSDEATKVAKCFRRDWMNARASLVDNYRQIEFFADQLESQLDLVFEGDIGNVGDNPFKLRYETGQLRAGFRFDAPIVRIVERNQYRAALINYQQTRRLFYQFEDEVQRNLRLTIRNMKRDQVLFELNRRSVQVQIEQIELNRFSLEEPPGVNAVNSRLGASTARNLTDAIIGLNTFQNRFLGTWVEYEVLRRSLDFDMGTMQLDSMGAWIDPILIDDAIGIRAALSMGIEPDCQFCELGTVVNPGEGIPIDSVAAEAPPAPVATATEATTDDQDRDDVEPFEAAQPSVETDSNSQPFAPPTERREPNSPTPVKLNAPDSSSYFREFNPSS